MLLIQALVYMVFPLLHFLSCNSGSYATFHPLANEQLEDYVLYHMTIGMDCMAFLKDLMNSDIWI